MKKNIVIAISWCATVGLLACLWFLWQQFSHQNSALRNLRASLWRQQVSTSYNQVNIAKRIEGIDSTVQRDVIDLLIQSATEVDVLREDNNIWHGGSELSTNMNALIAQDINCQIAQFNEERIPEMGITPITSHVDHIQLSDNEDSMECIDESGKTIVVLKQQPDGSFTGQTLTPFHELPYPDGHSWGNVILEISIPTQRKNLPSGVSYAKPNSF